MDPVLLFLLGFAAVFIVGIAGEVVFERTGVPDVVWLMVVGILLGPVLGVVKRDDLLAIGPYFGAITLVVVLFEGGSKLRLSEVSRALPRSSLLAVSGFVLNVAVVAVASMGARALGLVPASWGWLHGVILGAILGGSSSVVIMPALAKAKLPARIGSLVSVESALTDVLCVVVTVACIRIAVSGSSDPAIAGVILGKSFGIGLGVGLVVGMLWLLFLRALKDSPHAYAATLSILLVLYVVVQLFEGNSALAILAAAIVVGNAPALADSVGLRQDAMLSTGVQDTHAQITFIVKSFFFTFIGAMLGPPWALVALGLAFAVLLLVARVPAVLLSTAKSGMSGPERSIVTAMMPRGMAAGVLALMPYGAGMDGTEQLPVVVFGAVLFTIVFFALGLPLARRKLVPAGVNSEDGPSASTGAETAGVVGAVPSVEATVESAGPPPADAEVATGSAAPGTAEAPAAPTDPLQSGSS